MVARVNTFVRDKRKEFVRFFRFAVVGVIGAVVDLAVYNALIAFIHPPPPIADRLPEIAVFFSLSTAIVSNFIWNRYWTYPDSRSKPIPKQFTQFYLINILAYLIRAPIIALTKGPFSQLVGQVFPLDVETAIILGENLAWALGVGIAMLWNFFINRIVTYSDVDGADPEGDADRD